MIVDYRKTSTLPLPLHNGGAAVELVSCFECLCARVPDDLTWSTSTASIVKKAHPRLQRVVKTTERITGRSLPTISDIYNSSCSKKASRIISQGLY